MNVRNEFEAVAIMNIAFGNPAPEAGFEWFRIEKQCKNIKDEVNEMAAAEAAKNTDGMRDANCDVRVFAIGAAHLMGMDLKGALENFGTTYEIELLAAAMALESLDRFVFVYRQLMKCINDRDLLTTMSTLCVLMKVSDAYADLHGFPTQKDMQAVLTGVMTRFIKDEADKIATVAKHKAKGVTMTYFEGMYPTMIMKSAEDQPDAPKGKFLKSASYAEPVFAPLQSIAEPARRSTDKVDENDRRSPEGRAEMEKILALSANAMSMKRLSEINEETLKANG
jgi:hypothetical protein